MFFVVKVVHGVLKILNSETSPNQIAAGVVFGMLMGLPPLMSLHNFVLFLVVMLFRVNLSMFFVSLSLFSIVGWVFDPLWDRLGYWLLVDLKSVRPFWIQISEGAFLPYFHFNNTMVMGGLFVGLIASIPVAILSVMAVKVYRAKWRERMVQSKFVKALRATPIYGIYEKYEAAKAKLGLL